MANESQSGFDSRIRRVFGFAAAGATAVTLAGCGLAANNRQVSSASVGAETTLTTTPGEQSRTVVVHDTTTFPEVEVMRDQTLDESADAFSLASKQAGKYMAPDQVEKLILANKYDRGNALYHPVYPKLGLLAHRQLVLPMVYNLKEARAYESLIASAVNQFIQAGKVEAAQAEPNTVGGQPFLANVIKPETLSSTWNKSCDLKRSQVRVLQVDYDDNNGLPTSGSIELAASAVKPVGEIFEYLYDEHFHIQSLGYAGSNPTSADAKNVTYGLACGKDSSLSQREGLTLTINPVSNPSVSHGHATPSNASNYLNRNNVREGMITPSNPVIKFAASIGMHWGSTTTGPQAILNYGLFQPAPTQPH
jgi:hypothetical protein